MPRGQFAAPCHSAPVPLADIWRYSSFSCETILPPRIEPRDALAQIFGIGALALAKSRTSCLTAVSASSLASHAVLKAL